MKNNNDFLLLKWGTPKSWDLSNSPEAKKAMKSYLKTGGAGMGNPATDEQRELICRIIDGTNGPVKNWFTGEVYKDLEGLERAKAYVMEYGKKEDPPVMPDTKKRFPIIARILERFWQFKNKRS